MEGKRDMVIDFHTHLFPDKIAEKTIHSLAVQSGLTPFANGMAESLLEEMEEGDVALSVVLPVVTRPEQFATITKFACEINKKYGEGTRRFLSFGGIHPASDNYKDELRELKQLGFKGIKLHPDYQGANFNDMRYKHIVEEASKLDLIVSVHAGIDVGYPEPVHCTPNMAQEVIKEVKPTKLVLAHLGGWKLWDEVEELLAGQPVWFDTAVAFGVCSDEQLKRIIVQHGADRILFATDSPWSGQKESIEHLGRLGLTKREQEQILCRNALSLLKV